MAEIRGVVDAIETLAAPVRDAGRHDAPRGRDADRATRARRRASPAAASSTALRRLEARRAIVVSSPARGPRPAGARAGAAAAGCRSRRSCCRRARPRSGWPLSRTPRARWRALRAERGEPLVAIGGGALGDTAGFLAASWLRGVPVIHVPTTLVAQIDSSIGGKTAVDLPEGKNLVGAFHQPADVIDRHRASCASLPERQRRAALGEAVKMAVLGDERLFALLEAEGEAIAARRRGRFDDGRRGRARRACGVGQGGDGHADEREARAGAGST